MLLNEDMTVRRRVLADALKVSARTITGLVDGLVATGFMTREPHATDRRATLVTFTERGTAVMEAMGREQDGLAANRRERADHRTACYADDPAALVTTARHLTAALSKSDG